MITIDDDDFAGCGNGYVNTGEQCDSGPSNGLTGNGDVCDPPYDDSCSYCSSICTIVSNQG